MRHWLSFFLLIHLLCSLVHAESAYAQTSRQRVLDPEKTLTQFVHRSWDVSDGLPQNSVNAIVKTSDGFLWLGTQEGLVRFDGSVFKVYNRSTEDALRSDDIRVLKVDSQNVLWIGTRGGGVARYRDGVFAGGELDSTLDKARITGIQRALDNSHVWVGTSHHGVWKVRNGEAEKLDGLPSDAITSIVQDNVGALWIGTRDAGLLRWKDSDITAYSGDTGFISNDITALAWDDRAARLWVGTRDKGVLSMEGEDTAHYNTSTGLPTDNILSLYVDAGGIVWVGTDQAGLVRIIPVGAWENNVSQINSENGLSGDVVKAVFSDEEANLWVGTDGGGLNLFREGKFTTYTSNEGLVDDFVFSIHEDPQQAVWFSTQKGVTRMYEGTMTSFSVQDGLANEFVTSIVSTADSTVWMGTYGGGLSRYRDGSFSTFTDKNGLPDNGVFALFKDSKDVLWIGTGGGVVTYDEGIKRVITTDHGLTSNLITVIEEDNDGSMWVGTYNAGLNRIVGDKVMPFMARDGLSSDEILSLYVDDEGVLWVGTYGGGLNRIVNGVVTTYRTKDGMFNDNVSQILEDDFGYLWMSCNKGLFRVSKEELTAFAEEEIDRIHYEAFGTSDGLKSPEFNGGVQPAGWEGKDGRMWFPSGKGAAVIDPANIPRHTRPPTIYIEELIVDREPVDTNGQITLSPGEHNIEVHYIGLNFVAAERTRYWYKLDGVDSDWQDAGSRRTAYYTSLDPGEYTFRVIAENSDGIQSESAAEISFYLRPYFYETVWFYILSGILLTTFGYVFYQRRLAQIRENERELERLVEDRTRVLEKRTADLLQTLEHNKEIMGITSHDLKNPLGGIIGLADMLMEDLGNLSGLSEVEESLENVELVKSEAERMLRIIKDLLDKHREGGDSILKKELIDLSALVEDALRWNDQKARQKNISVTYSESGEQLIYGDADALLRVIDNLVSNAIKYSPPGRRVWVTLSEVYGEALFQVLDEGPGLTQEDMGKVFGKMQRLSAKPTAGEHSTGLGLYIVKQLVEEHEGEVGVDSVYGQGATFWFKLPLYENSSEGIVKREKQVLIEIEDV